MLRDDAGVALVVALMVLLGVTGVVLSLLSISALEPQISRNHTGLLHARYLAEAGIEHAYAILGGSVGAWDTHLVGASCSAGAVLVRSPLPGLTPAHGEYTVRVRNDCDAHDNRLTAAPAEPVANAGTDTNGRVIVVSTGAFGETTHTLTAVIFYNSGAPGQSGSTARLGTYNWADH